MLPNVMSKPPSHVSTSIKIRLLMVDIMQRFSTHRSILCKAYKTCESIYFHFSSIDIPFSDLNMVREMPLRQKEAYAPPLENIRAKHSQ